MSDVVDAEGDAETDADATEDETAGASGAAEDDGLPDPLVARIASIDEAAAADVEERIDALRATVEDHEAALAEREETIDELESKLKRARADFQNYKKRAERRQEEIRERATEDLVERLLDVRDNLVRAVEQDADVEVREGVEATLATFDRILDSENVAAIEPSEGEDVDPERHEVVHRTESDHPEGVIAGVYRPGYEMAEQVLRPAQVTVSEGTEDPGEPGGGETE